MHGGVKTSGQLHSPTAFVSRESSVGIRWGGGSVIVTAALHTVQKRKISAPVGVRSDIVRSFFS